MRSIGRVVAGHVVSFEHRTMKSLDCNLCVHKYLCKLARGYLVVVL
jgi:hypothetical protein